MKARWSIWLSGAAIVAIALGATGVAAQTSSMTQQSAPKLLHRCANDYAPEEIEAMLANGEDSYEPDDCALLAPTLTGPMSHNFCQPGDEDWVKFTAKTNTIYQIKASAPSNYPTEPYLDLLESDGSLIGQNDHYFDNIAEIWWWNGDAERTVFVRVTEMRERAECGNSEYTLSLTAFKDKP